MDESTEGSTLIEHQSYLWPVIIFPYYERSHTASMIGCKARRPRILKNVKASFAGRVWLTERYLRAHNFLLGGLLSIEIPLDSIVSVKASDQDKGLVKIRFQQAELSRLLRFLVKGSPKGIILLKLDEAAGSWLRTLAEKPG